ncbi:MAG: hypothetical protein QM786_01260 [Breznakibacter sp.]
MLDYKKGITLGEIRERQETDIYAALRFSADRESRIYQVAV